MSYSTKASCTNSSNTAWEIILYQSLVGWIPSGRFNDGSQATHSRKNGISGISYVCARRGYIASKSLLYSGAKFVGTIIPHRTICISLACIVSMSVDIFASRSCNESDLIPSFAHITMIAISHSWASSSSHDDLETNPRDVSPESPALITL